MFDDINADIGRLTEAAHSRLDVSETGSQIKVTAEHPGAGQRCFGYGQGPARSQRTKTETGRKNKKPARVATPALDARTVG